MDAITLVEDGVFTKGVYCFDVAAGLEIFKNGWHEYLCHLVKHDIREWNVSRGRSGLDQISLVPWYFESKLLDGLSCNFGRGWHGVYSMVDADVRFQMIEESADRRIGDLRYLGDMKWFRILLLERLLGRGVTHINLEFEIMRNGDES